MTGLQVNPSFSYPCLRNSSNRPKTEIKRKRLHLKSGITRNTRDQQDNLPLLGLSGIHVGKNHYNSLQANQIKKELEIPMLDKRNSIKSNRTREIMNERNLRIHNDETRRASLISNLERISQWAKSIPHYEPLDIYAIDKVSNELLETNIMPSSRLPSPMSQNVTKMIERAQSSKEQSRLPCLTRIDSEISRTCLKNSNHKKERLLCCLKVEIKSEVFKMLPVHSNDDPITLATSFCKSFNLQSSITNLSEHITQSKIKFSKLY